MSITYRIEWVNNEGKVFDSMTGCDSLDSVKEAIAEHQHYTGYKDCKTVVIEVTTTEKVITVPTWQKVEMLELHNRYRKSDRYDGGIPYVTAMMLDGKVKWESGQWWELR